MTSLCLCVERGQDTQRLFPLSSLSHLIFPRLEQPPRHAELRARSFFVPRQFVQPRSASRPLLPGACPPPAEPGPHLATISPLCRRQRHAPGRNDASVPISPARHALSARLGLAPTPSPRFRIRSGPTSAAMRRLTSSQREHDVSVGERLDQKGSGPRISVLQQHCSQGLFACGAFTTLFLHAPFNADCIMQRCRNAIPCCTR